MSTNNVSLNSFKFNQAVFNKKLESALYSFKSSPIAIETIHLPVALAVDKIVELTHAGRVVSKFRVPQISGGMLLVSFEKQNLEDDLKRIEQELKADYELELAAEKERNVQLLAAQLFEQELKKETLANEKKLATQKEKAQQQAAEYFAKEVSA